MLGIVFAITAGACWGIAATFVRLGLQGIRSTTAALISMLSSILLICSLALILDYDAVLSLTPKTVLWFGLVGVVTYVLGRQFNYSAIRRIGVGKATPIFASAPLFAIIIAIISIGESINLSIIIGTLFIVVGLYFVLTSR
jgi:drug/metabolite transporter (DMT)-like permease